MVADATATTSVQAHETAIQRMVMSGIVPVTWWSLAAEFQLDPEFRDFPARSRLMAAHQPLMMMSGRTFFAGAAAHKADEAKAAAGHAG